MLSLNWIFLPDDMFRSGKVLITDLPLNLQKYFVKDGSFLKMGMKVKRPDVADILQEISEKGSSALYNGKYTKEISDVVCLYIRTNNIMHVWMCNVTDNCIIIYYDRSLQVPHKDKSVISSVCCQAESGHG